MHVVIAALLPVEEHQVRHARQRFSELLRRPREVPRLQVLTRSSIGTTHSMLVKELIYIRDSLIPGLNLHWSHFVQSAS